MYIHGFIDGALAVIVLEIAALIVVAVIYSRKKEVVEDGAGGGNIRCPFPALWLLCC